MASWFNEKENQKKLWEQEQEALGEHLKIKAKSEELKKRKGKENKN